MPPRVQVGVQGGIGMLRHTVRRGDLFESYFPALTAMFG